jgi:hypothetical protein
MNQSQQANYLSDIHQLLLAHFNEEDLKTLCLRLGVEYDDLPGSGRSSKARELITYLQRRGRLEELRPAVVAVRPNAVWPGAATAPSPASTPEPPVRRNPDWPPDPADIDRLVAILQAQPQFADPHQRLSFLQQVFVSSPRQQDILGLINVAGFPRSVAMQVVSRLIQFGQDKPGRETLGLLVSAMLAGYGAHPDADFLRGLLDRYPMGVTVADEPSPQPSSHPVHLPTSERFLGPDERRWLAATMGNLSRFQDLPGRRNLLIESQVPDQWIGEISLERGGVLEVAKAVIYDLGPVDI